MSIIKQTVKRVDKIWGHELWYCNFEGLYCGKMLVLKPGFQMSLHKHPVKHETFLVLVGQIMATYENYAEYFHEGAVVTIEPGTLHSMSAVHGEAKLIEFSTFHDESDVIRLSESHKIEESK